MQGIQEGDGKNSGVGGVVADWRGCDGPFFASVARMKDSPATCSKPDFMQSNQENTTITRSERSFIRQGGWGFFVLPCFPAIVGCHYYKMAVYRVAEQDSVGCVPECYGVEKALGIGVGIEDIPGSAGVFSLVNP